MSEPRVSAEIVVVGGGPAGLAAASVAAESGREILLIDESPWLGGQIWRGQQTHPSEGLASTWLARFARSGAKVLDCTVAIAASRPGRLLVERQGLPCELAWDRLILATGARELFLPFPGWTLPGIIGPGGLQVLIKNGWPVHGKRVLVAGSGPLLLALARTLRQQGAHVISIAEQAPWQRVFGFGFGLLARPAKLRQALALKLGLTGIPYRCGTWPVRAEGTESVERVALTDGTATWSADCDLFACGFGLVPNVELPLALGCELKDGFVRVDEFQAASAPNIFCAGEPTGIGGADCALVEGRIAGYAAAGLKAQAEALFGDRWSWHRFRAALQDAFALRPQLKQLPTDNTIVCRCEDVSWGRLREFTCWREAKLHSRCGMGNCQGRVCGSATRLLLGWGMESVRPPVVPARVGSLISPS
jgi:D-hydroxyproline dehydrogenase subunit alpha